MKKKDGILIDFKNNSFAEIRKQDFIDENNSF
jgi:hypothetical protein